MSDEATGGQSGESPSLGQRMKKGFESKVLIPAAVAVVSAAASYLLRKLPVLLEEKVLPKLQEKGAPDAVTGVVEQATALAGGSEGGRSASADEGSADKDSSSDRSSSGKSSAGKSGTAAKAAPKSDEEREGERAEREQRRKERKRALERSA